MMLHIKIGSLKKNCVIEKREKYKYLRIDLFHEEKT